MRVDFVTHSGESAYRMSSTTRMAGRSGDTVPESAAMVRQIRYTYGRSSVGGSGEPDPRAAGPRTARARPHHSPAAGQVPPPIRSRHQSRHRAERAGRNRGGSRAVSRPGAVLQGGAGPAAGRRRGRNRRVGQPPRGAGPVGALRQAARAVPPVRAGRHGRRRAGGSARTTRFTSPRSGAIHTVGDQVRFTLVHRSREGVRPPRPRRGGLARGSRPHASRPSEPASAGRSRHDPLGRPARRSDRQNARSSESHATSAATSTSRSSSRSASPATDARRACLYWFRTPPGIKVGREPFERHAPRDRSAESRRSCFDWERFSGTPIPPWLPVDWRERRRAERAARTAGERR